MKFKLSPIFMLTTLLLAAFAPFTFGVTVETIAASSAVLVAATLMVVPGVSVKRSAFGQLGELGEGNVEKEYKQVQANLKDIGDQLKAHAEAAQQQIKAHQQMSEQTKASVDELLTKQGELNARLQAAEQALADNRGGEPGAVLSMGRKVIDSDEFNSQAPRLASAKGSFSVNVQSALTTTQFDDADGYPVAPQRVPGIMGAPERRMTVRDLLNWGETNSNSVEYVRETGFTTNADVVSENPTSGAPKSEITFELDSANVATVSHYVHASKQVLADAGMLQAHIDGRLRYGLMLKEEAQLLKGSGVGLNMNGLFTQASAYANPGVDVTNDTVIDRLRIAMLQVQLAEYSADGIVLNPIDWAGIELTKDSQGRYVFANPLGLAGPVLWGLPVAATQAMDAGDFLTGAFRMGAQGWDRQDASVIVSTEDRDNLIKGMVTILAEERVALTVYRPESFVKGDFTIASSGA